MRRRENTSSAGHRILCVDDDLVCLQLRQTLLESNGYAVIISDGPFEALKQDFDAVDLAFVDYDMPEMNGRELLLRMRASNATFPIVLLSGQPIRCRSRCASSSQLASIRARRCERCSKSSSGFGPRETWRIGVKQVAFSSQT